MRRFYLEVHGAVFLFGMTGLFAKFLDQNPLVIVWGRVFFSSLLLAVWLTAGREGFGLDQRKDMGRLLGLGLLLSFHWTTFFGAIQLSNVAVGLLTFSTFPIFVSLIKGLIFGQGIKKEEIVCGLIALMGIALIVPFENIQSKIFAGALTGVASGASYAFFTLWNEGLVKTYSGRKVAFYEHLAATLLLLPALLIIQPRLTLYDWGLLLLLGTVFTGIGHALFINGLKEVSAYMAGMITMLEPLYAILLAYLFFGETIDGRTLAGGVCILGTVVYLSLKRKKRSPGKEKMTMDEPEKLL